jgi:hypothetical protein
VLFLPVMRASSLRSHLNLAHPYNSPTSCICAPRRFRLGTGRQDYSLPDGTDRLSDKRKEPFFTVLCKGDRSTTYIWHIEMLCGHANTISKPRSTEGPSMDRGEVRSRPQSRHESITEQRIWVEGHTGSDVESLRCVDLGTPGVVPCVEYFGDVAPLPLGSSPRGCRVPMEGERG